MRATAFQAEDEMASMAFQLFLRQDFPALDSLCQLMQLSLCPSPPHFCHPLQMPETATWPLSLLEALESRV